MGRPEAKVFADDISLHTLDAPELEFHAFTVNDAGGVVNGKLDPGEEAAITLTLRNCGGAAPEVSARLVSQSPFLEVIDGDGVFGPTGPGDSTVSPTDAFRVRASLSAPVEEAVWCELLLSGAAYEDTVAIPILVGDSMNLPLGPDACGYLLFDYTDSCYSERPDYEWVELRGVGTRLALGNDETRAIELPAEFGSWRWYGQDYDSLSVCSNGWIAAGVTDRPDFVNIILPYENSPANMLAFWWCDLDPSRYGSIWYWHDSANHRFIVEFDSVAYFATPTNWEKVQVHLYDRSVPTPSGDNTVVLQYQTANDFSLVTVAFQNQTGTSGLTHVWNDWYPRVSAPIRGQRALRIQPGEMTSVAGPGPARRVTDGRCTHPGLARCGDAVAFEIGGQGLRLLQVRDAAGRRVFAGRLEPGQTRLRWLTRGRSPGVYFVSVGPAAVSKLVLTR